MATKTSRIPDTPGAWPRRCKASAGGLSRTFTVATPLQGQRGGSGRPSGKLAALAGGAGLGSSGPSGKAHPSEGLVGLQESSRGVWWAFRKARGVARACSLPCVRARVRGCVGTVTLHGLRNCKPCALVTACRCATVNLWPRSA